MTTLSEALYELALQELLTKLGCGDGSELTAAQEAVYEASHPA